MPVTDTRNTVDHLHTGGSDLGLQVLLSSTEAESIYGTGSTEGWYTVGTFDGGSFGDDVQSERDKDEAGQFTGKIIINSQEWFISNTIKESDDETLNLLQLLSASPHRYRYALPAGEKEFDVDGTGTMETHKAHQVWGLYNGQVDPGLDFPTQDGEKRMTDVEFRGSKTKDNPPYLFKTVWVDDDSTWQYVDGSDLTDFMDAATP